MHDSAQEPMRPSSILWIDPNPAHRANLRRLPFDHLRQRTPTTSASTRRTRTCDSAAVPAFLSTTADAVTAPTPPPHSPPVPPCHRRADAGRQAWREHLPFPRLPSKRGSCIHNNTNAEQPPPLLAACAALGAHRGRRLAGDACRVCTDVVGAFGLQETRSESVISGKRRMLVAQG
jgi:hypothetical protein